MDSLPRARARARAHSSKRYTCLPVVWVGLHYSFHTLDFASYIITAIVRATNACIIEYDLSQCRMKWDGWDKNEINWANRIPRLRRSMGFQLPGQKLCFSTWAGAHYKLVWYTTLFHDFCRRSCTFTGAIDVYRRIVRKGDLLVIRTEPVPDELGVNLPKLAISNFLRVLWRRDYGVTCDGAVGRECAFRRGGLSAAKRWGLGNRHLS